MRGPSPDVAPISDESGAGIIASLAGQAPPTVVPMPLEGQVVGEAKGVPSEVAEQTATEAIPLLTLEWAELLVVFVALAKVGVAQPDEVPPTKVEVMVAMMDGS